MFERCLYFNTNSLARKLNAVWEKAFDAFELPPSHAYLLRLILECPGLNQQELAKEMRLNKSTITRFVTALEKKGLLVSKASPSSQREKLIAPSKKAQGIQKRLEAQGDELYASMCESIGEKNLEAFVKAARNINEKL